jgi:hypothetical protein
LAIKTDNNCIFEYNDSYTKHILVIYRTVSSANLTQNFNL